MMEKTVFTRKIASELVKLGFPVVRVIQNPRKPEFDAYVFQNTDEFKLAFTNLANRAD